MPIIECRQLTRVYTRGNQTITPLERLDLAVEEGESLALMGPSRSGITTLINWIAGIDPSTSSELIIIERNVAALTHSPLTDRRGDYVGYVLQLYNLIPALTAYENVELPLLLLPFSRKERHRSNRLWP